MMLSIDGRDVKFSTSVTFFYIYKREFGEDIIQVIMPALQRLSPLVGQAIAGKGKEIELDTLDIDLILEALNEVEMTDLLNIIWAMAKDANDEIVPIYEWFKQFDSFPIIDVLVKLLPELVGSMMTKKKVSEAIKKTVQKAEASTLKQS